MTDLNDTNFLPRPLPPTAPAPGGGRQSAWRRPLIAAGLFAGVVALGAGAYAATGSNDDASGWKQTMRLAFVQRMVEHALDGVGASSEQEAKIHDIVAARFAELGPDPEARSAMRKQALDLLGQPTIDRAAVEKMRLDAVAKFDAKSKAFVAGLLDIADQLTPEQRAKLTAHIEAMADRGRDGGGPWGHWGHGGGGGWGGWGHRDGGDRDRDGGDRDRGSDEN